MKHCLLIALVLISLKGKSQMADTTQKRLRVAGLELIKYQHQIGIGGALMVLGGGGAVAASAADSKANKTVVYIGAGVGFVGFLITLIASNHIGNAGIILSGNKISIPLHK